MAFHLAANDCELDRCRDCGFVQVRSIPTSGELDAIYRTAYFEKPKYVDDRAARHEFTRRLGLLGLAGLMPSWRVLDYGCATGEFVHGIASICSAFGVDFSADAIAKAKVKYPELSERFATLDGLPDEVFDAIVMWDVIEHVPEPNTVLRNLAARLRPGGVLILSTPNVGAVVARVMGRRWAFMTPPEHLGLFDRKSMTRALSLANLDLQDWSSRGKLVNVAFLLYKLGRVFPALMPKPLRQAVARSPLGRLCVYIPTNDIQYVICRKPKEAVL